MAVQKITYDDKSYLNQNSDIADVNKCNDTDLNEIKSVVNNNATELTNIMGKILWTNPNPTENFLAQTITLSSSNYDMYEVIFYGSKTKADTLTTGKIPKGENIFTMQVYNVGAGNVLRTRAIKYIDDTTLNVNEGFQDGNQALQVNIPAYIIGYKTGLFN